jgi:hypothetical protein
MGQRRGAYWVLVGKTEEKRALGKPGHGWDGSIKTDTKLGWGVDWTDQARDRCSWRGLVSTVTNFGIP